MPPTLLCKVFAVPETPMPRRTANGQKICIISLVAKAKQGGAMLLERDAAKWFSEDVRRIVLALDVLGLDGAVGQATSSQILSSWRWMCFDLAWLTGSWA
eukprot:407480-Pleurochrysis_carterae.AAC.1